MAAKRQRAVRTAIVGTGGIATVHADALRAQGDRVELVAAADLDRNSLAAFAARHGVPATYTDVDELLRVERPELVHVCTPPRAHAELTAWALGAGAWVLCEKPPCGSLAELDRIAEAERDADGYASFVAQWRFGSGARHLKKLIETELGPPLMVVAQLNLYRDAGYFADPWRGTWTVELGGPVVSQAIHSINLLLWLLGEWREARCKMARLDRPVDTEDAAMATIEFESGALLCLVTSVVSPGQETSFRFDFDRVTVDARYLYRYTNADWTFTGIPGEEQNPDLVRWSQIRDEVAPTHASQIAALLDSMEEGARPAVGVAESRAVVELLSALYKAAFTGAPVRRGSIVPGDPFYERLHGGVDAWSENAVPAP